VRFRFSGKYTHEFQGNPIFIWAGRTWYLTENLRWDEMFLISAPVLEADCEKSLRLTAQTLSRHTNPGSVSVDMARTRCVLSELKLARRCCEPSSYSPTKSTALENYINQSPIFKSVFTAYGKFVVKMVVQCERAIFLLYGGSVLLVSSLGEGPNAPYGIELIQDLETGPEITIFMAHTPLPPVNMASPTNTPPHVNTSCKFTNIAMNHEECVLLSSRRDMYRIELASEQERNSRPGIFHVARSLFARNSVGMGPPKLNEDPAYISLVHGGVGLFNRQGVIKDHICKRDLDNDIENACDIESVWNHYNRCIFGSNNQPTDMLSWFSAGNSHVVTTWVKNANHGGGEAFYYAMGSNHCGQIAPNQPKHKATLQKSDPLFGVGVVEARWDTTMTVAWC
jgi:hypothetical protein